MIEFLQNYLSISSSSNIGKGIGWWCCEGELPPQQTLFLVSIPSTGFVSVLRDQTYRCAVNDDASLAVIKGGGGGGRGCRGDGWGGGVAS